MVIIIKLRAAELCSQRLALEGESSLLHCSTDGDRCRDDRLERVSVHRELIHGQICLATEAVDGKTQPVRVVPLETHFEIAHFKEA